MVDAIEIDHEDNPICRLAYLAGSLAGTKVAEFAERRRGALLMLRIALPDREEKDRRAVAALSDDVLVAPVENLLTSRSREARRIWARSPAPSRPEGYGPPP